MTGTVVGVLRGGRSSEHDVSLKSGHAILANLPSDRYTTRDIYIDKQGLWHERGMPTAPEKILPSIDVAFVPLHGEGGQDGTIQRLLEQYGVPYTGASPFASFNASHKLMAKERAKELGVLTPKYFYVEYGDDAAAAAQHITRSFHQPVVVKPVARGSSVGVSIVGGYANVFTALTHLLPYGGVLVEEAIVGREATVGIVDGLRGEKFYRLPPIEIIPPEGSFFDYENKYNGRTHEIVPGRFSKSESDELMRLAALMHEALDQRHYSRSDFIVSPKGIYYLETNTAAAVGMTEQSLFPKALAAVGVGFSEFLTHVLDLALAY